MWKELLLAATITGAACAPAPARQEPVRSPAPIAGTPRAAEGRLTPVVPIGPQRPQPTETVTLPTSLDQLNKLPARTRIKYLESTQNLPFPFDHIQTLAAATADFRCEVTDCNITPKKMTDSITALPSDQFVQAKEREEQRILTEKEKENTAKFTAEFVSLDKKKMYLNLDSIEGLVKEIDQANPDIRKTLEAKNIDLRKVVETQIDVHAQSHMNQSKEIYKFPPVTISYPRSDMKFTVHEIRGLTIYGPSSDDKGEFEIPGSMETLTEYTTEQIIKQAGFSYISIPPHSDGVSLLQALLQKTSFTPKQVLDVYHGKVSIEKLFLALGSIKNGNQPNKEAGIRAYTTIGFFIDGFIPLDTAHEMLEVEFGQKFFS